MPAYNAEKYLREAIDSILSQTFADFEFIIINDGSTDSTKDIIQSYNDPRIVYLENEKNSGICITLNKGLDAARGKYIARMDADDISLPERLARQVEYMDANPEIGALGTDIEIFGDGICPYVFHQLHTPEECKAGLIFNSCFAHPTVIMRHSVLETNGLRYNDNYRGLEDYELWWQIGKYAELNNLKKPLLKYRHHKGQETQNVSPKVRAAYLQFIINRMQDLKVVISKDDIQLMQHYGNGNYPAFTTEKLINFISLSSRITAAYNRIGNNKLTRAAKLTTAKAVTYIINNSPHLADSVQKHYNTAWRAGVFPAAWYIKICIHNFH